MAEKREAEGTDEWAELDWQAPDEKLDDVLMPVEDEKEVDPRGLEPLA